MVKDTNRIIVSVAVLIPLVLAGIYIAGKILPNFPLEITPIIFFIIIGLVLFALLQLLRQTGARALDLDSLFIPFIVLGGAVYFLIKFPRFIPFFSTVSIDIGKTTTVGMPTWLVGSVIIAGVLAIWLRYKRKKR